MQDYILEVKDLCKYYPGVKALDGVSVGFKEGRYTRWQEKTARGNQR